MSKDPFNPFASLDAKSFPKRSKGSSLPKARGLKTIVKNPKNRNSPDDEDAELFLQYVGMDDAPREKESLRRSPAPVSGKNGKTAPGKAAYAPSSSPETGMREALAGLGGNFRPLGGKKDSQAAPAAPAAGCDGDDGSGTLIQMARNARRIAASGNEGSLAEELGSPEGDADGSVDFLNAVKGTKRLGGSGRDVPAEPEVQNVPYTDPRHPLQDFMEGKVEFSVASTDEYAEGHVVGLDLMVVSQLQSGQLSPEAHIDLHGLNSSQAYSNLVGFFRSAWYKGVRVVLVVTGRGLNSLNGMPVLRGKVQEWLMHDPFKRVVLAFCSARQEDGGAGAFYVLLRKYRKGSGKIRWDSMPEDPDLYL